MHPPNQVLNHAPYLYVMVCQASVLQRGADQQSFDTLLLGSQPCLLDSGWLWTACRGLDASDACMPEQWGSLRIGVGKTSWLGHRKWEEPYEYLLSSSMIKGTCPNLAKARLRALLEHCGGSRNKEPAARV